MGDKAYLDRAQRQRNRLILIGVLLLLAVCGAFAVRNSIYDLCTASFSRDPRDVVDSYLQAVANGDPVRAQDCWDHNAFFDISAGCSEACLSRALGTQFSVKHAELEPQTIEDGRARITARITAACPQGDAVSGTLLLDSLASGMPWKHWRVIRSTVGGNSAQIWCQP